MKRFLSLKFYSFNIILYLLILDSSIFQIFNFVNIYFANLPFFSQNNVYLHDPFYIDKNLKHQCQGKIYKIIILYNLGAVFKVNIFKTQFIKKLYQLKHCNEQTLFGTLLI